MGGMDAFVETEIDLIFYIESRGFEIIIINL